MSEGGTSLRVFGRRLSQAVGALEVAKLVCGETKRLFEIDQCMVTYNASSGRPVMMVDNMREVTDEYRLAWVSGGIWKHDLTYRALFEHHRPIGGEAAEARTLLLPIIEPAGLLGAIRCVHCVEYPRDLQRDLIMMSTLVAVRLAHLGVTAFADTPAVAKLTRRQHEVARLAARAYSNPEIADTLGISQNTVKNRLKEVFERLHVVSRIELVGALHRTAPSDDIPTGITRDGSLTITRAQLTVERSS